MQVSTGLSESSHRDTEPRLNAIAATFTRLEYVRETVVTLVVVSR